MNSDWAREQLNAVGINPSVNSNYRQVTDAVLRLLEYWETIDHDPALENTILKLFDRLARGHALVEQQDEVWVPLQPGQVAVRDTVRVKADAFTGDYGRVHNGRRGEIIAIRRGDIMVAYRDGKEPKTPDMGIHHSMAVLEKRIR